MIFIYSRPRDRDDPDSHLNAVENETSRHVDEMMLQTT
jgi:hypothetical protein